MRHTGWTLTLIVLTTAWSGCFGNEDPVSPAAVDVSATSPAATLVTDPVTGLLSADAPVWNVGDAWSIEASGGGETRTSDAIVVAAGSSYTLATTDKDLVAYDALEDISWIGAIRTKDLAGSQGGVPVRFFDFPLESNKTWSTVWDGNEVTITATAKPNGNGFDLVARNGDDVQVTYDYDPELRWWSHIDFGGDYGIRILKRTENWTGEYYTGTANTLVEFVSAPPALTQPATAFTVAEGQEFISLGIRGYSNQHARGLMLIDPNGMPFLSDNANFAASPQASTTNIQERIPATPGEWHIVAPIAHGDGAYEVAIKEVAIIASTLG